MANVTVYGADWCGETRLVRDMLEDEGVTYEYIDIDNDKEAEAKVIRWNGGEKRKIPVVVMTLNSTESLCIAPTKRELQKELDRLWLDAA
jgi:mycoredoxin